MQDFQIQQLMEEIAQEQAINFKLKERKPQRLAPLAQRDGSLDEGQKQQSYDLMDGIEVSDDMQHIGENDNAQVDNTNEEQME